MTIRHAKCGQHHRLFQLKLFVDFYYRKIKYGLYRHSDKSYLRVPFESLPEDFVLEEMI